MRFDRGFALRALLGIAISIGAIWILLRSVDVGAAFALALLAHAMILAVTSVGGAVAALRLGVGLRTGPAAREDAPGS